MNDNSKKKTLLQILMTKCDPKKTTYIQTTYIQTNMVVIDVVFDVSSNNYRLTSRRSYEPFFFARTTLRCFLRMGVRIITSR